MCMYKAIYVYIYVFKTLACAPTPLAGVSGYTWVGSNEFTMPPYVQIRWRPGGSCCESSRYAKR